MRKNLFVKIPYKFKKWTFGYNCLLFQIEEAYLEKINLEKKGKITLH